MSTIHMARCPGALHIQIHFLMAYEDVARQQFLLWIVSCCHVINEKFWENLQLISSTKTASSYIVQYPVLRTIQSALHFTSLTDLFTQTPSGLLWEASSHMLQFMHEGCSYTYPPLPLARYSFIQLSELEQCRVKKLAQCFNTTAQDSNPGSRSRESEALPLSHCALWTSQEGSGNEVIKSLHAKTERESYLQHWCCPIEYVLATFLLAWIILYAWLAE